MRDIKEKIGSRGMEPYICTADEPPALMKAKMAKFAKFIKTANIKLEN